LPGGKTRRLTKQRRTILDELRKLTTHPSADELHRKVRRRLPGISLGTVYRNLEVLSGQGEVEKIELAGAQRRYDARTAPHYHLRCVACGAVEDAPLEPIKSLDDRLRGRTDYEVLGHRVEFIGLCPRCRTRRRTRSLGRGDTRP